MSERIPNTNTHDQFEAPGKDNESVIEQNWDDINERLDTINLPDDPRERLDDILGNFAGSGLDVEMLSLAIHQVLVPGAESKPTEHAMKVGSGDTNQVLMNPEDRSDLFASAAEIIGQLGALRTPGLSAEAAQIEDQAILQRIGNVMSLAIVQTHQFPDGNGRTSRVVGELIRNGTTQPDVVELAGTNRPEQGFRINSYVPKDDTLQPAEVLRRAAAFEIPLGDREQYAEATWPVYSTPYNEAEA